MRSAEGYDALKKSVSLISYHLLIKTSSSSSRKQNACGASIVIGYSCALVKDAVMWFSLDHKQRSYVLILTSPISLSHESA